MPPERPGEALILTRPEGVPSCIPRLRVRLLHVACRFERMLSPEPLEVSPVSER
jgi:hypothetical protein